MKNLRKGQILRKGFADSVGQLTTGNYKPISKKGHTTNVIKHKNFSLESYPEDKSVYRFCISSEAVDRDGDIVIQKGIKYDDFTKNPVVFWGHEWDSVPIGKVISVTHDETEQKTYADVILGSTPRAQEIETLVKEGIVQATSIGFRINDWDWSDELDALLYTETELLELSLVGLPANQEAVGGEEVKEIEPEVGEKGLTLSPEGIVINLKEITEERLQEMIAEAVAEAVAAAVVQPADPEPVKPEDEEEDVEEANDKEDNEEEEATAPKEEPEAATLEEQLAAMEERLLDALQNIGENDDGDGKPEVDPEPAEEEADEEDGSAESEEADDDGTPVIIISE